MIQQSLPEHNLFFKQAKKDHFNGRPVNDMFIAIPAKLKPCVTDVSPINQRIQALIIRATAYRILLLNVYFPTDCKTFNGTIDDKLENILVETKNIIQNEKLSNQNALFIPDYSLFLGFPVNLESTLRSHQFSQENEQNSLF